MDEITRLPRGAELRDSFLISKNDIRIDGIFSGKIIAKGKLVIGEHAYVKGDIVCKNADISGRVEGNIYVGEILALMGPCDFNGQINAQKLSMEAGAKFSCNCKMITPEEYAKIEAEIGGEVVD